MDILYLLVAVSVLLIIGVAIILLWAIRNGQYEDLDGPAWRVLADDDGIQAPQPNQPNRDSERPTADEQGSK
jgi:cbb3-type cytochrome oxidase maturation protein